MSIAMQALQDAMTTLMILGGLFFGPWLLIRFGRLVFMNTFARKERTDGQQHV